MTFCLYWKTNKLFELYTKPFPMHISQCMLLCEASFGGAQTEFISEIFRSDWQSERIQVISAGPPNMIRLKIKILALKYKNGNVHYNKNIKMKRNFMCNINMIQYDFSFGFIDRFDESKHWCLDNNNWCLFTESGSAKLQLKLIQLPYNVSKIAVKWHLDLSYEH